MLVGNYWPCWLVRIPQLLSINIPCFPNLTHTGPLNPHWFVSWIRIVAHSIHIFL
jgi:hypothetical protein